MRALLAIAVLGFAVAGGAPRARPILPAAILRFIRRAISNTANAPGCCWSMLTSRASPCAPIGARRGATIITSRPTESGRASAAPKILLARSARPRPAQTYRRTWSNAWAFKQERAPLCRSPPATSDRHRDRLARTMTTAIRHASPRHETECTPDIRAASPVSPLSPHANPMRSSPSGSTAAAPMLPCAARIAAVTAPSPCIARAASIVAHKPVDRALVAELRKRSERKDADADAKKKTPPIAQDKPRRRDKRSVFKTKRIVRDRPVVIVHKRYVDDPPRVIDRRIVVDDAARADCNRGLMTRCDTTPSPSLALPPRRSRRRRGGQEARHQCRGGDHHSRARPHEHPAVPQGTRPERPRDDRRIETMQS